MNTKHIIFSLILSIIFSVKSYSQSNPNVKEDLPATKSSFKNNLLKNMFSDTSSTINIDTLICIKQDISFDFDFQKNINTSFTNFDDIITFLNNKKVNKFQGVYTKGNVKLNNKLFKEVTYYISINRTEVKQSKASMITIDYFYVKNDNILAKTVIKYINSSGLIMYNTEHIINPISLEINKLDFNVSAKLNNTDKYNLSITKFDIDEKYTASVFNMQGRELMTFIVKDKNTIIDFTDYNKGIYIIKVSNGNEVKTKKYLKK